MDPMEARGNVPITPADVEVVAKARRRAFTAEYKRRVLKEADACATPGAVGALLRREGLYSSHLVVWRRARARGELAALTSKKRGRKSTPVDPRARRIADLERLSRDRVDPFAADDHLRHTPPPTSVKF